MSEEGATMHAILLVTGETIPPINAIQDYLLAHFPDSLPVTDAELDDKGLIFWLGEQMLSISSMGAAYPADELPELCDRAWWWPEASAEVPKHNNHIIVSSISNEGPISSAVALTQVTCALIATTISVAVIWGAAEAIHASNDFVESTLEALKEQPPLPLNLWVDIQVGTDQEQQTMLYTVGFEALGYPEIEVQKSNLEPEELLNIVMPLMLYIAEEDVVFEDGATFGTTEDEFFPINYGPSMLDAKREVLILGLA